MGLGFQGPKGEKVSLLKTSGGQLLEVFLNIYRYIYLLESINRENQ